jgi:NAD-dependent SIR2 family protein deacetylase
VADTVPTALRAGASLVILNDQSTPFDAHADVVLHGSISDVLPRLVAVPALD